MECAFRAHIKHPSEDLCMLYCEFTINGHRWAHYPNCCERNCPFIHPELLGELIWEDENTSVV